VLAVAGQVDHGRGMVAGGNGDVDDLDFGCACIIW
jgi:hypothetical protein